MVCDLMAALAEVEDWQALFEDEREHGWRALTDSAIHSVPRLWARARAQGPRAPHYDTLRRAPGAILRPPRPLRECHLSQVKGACRPLKPPPPLLCACECVTCDGWLLLNFLL